MIWDRIKSWFGEWWEAAAVFVAVILVIIMVIAGVATIKRAIPDPKPSTSNTFSPYGGSVDNVSPFR